MAKPIIYYFWFNSLFDHYKKVQNFKFPIKLQTFLEYVKQYLGKIWTLILWYLANFTWNFCKITVRKFPPPLLTFAFRWDYLLYTVHSRDFDLFYFMTLVLQEFDKTYLYSNRRVYPILSGYFPSYLLNLRSSPFLFSISILFLNVEYRR